MLQANGIAQPSPEPQPQVPEPERVGAKRKSLSIKEEDRQDGAEHGDEDADEEEKALLVSTCFQHFLSISVKYVSCSQSDFRPSSRKFAQGAVKGTQTIHGRKQRKKIHQTRLISLFCLEALLTSHKYEVGSEHRLQ